MNGYGDGLYGDGSYARLRELVLARDPTCRIRFRGCLARSTTVIHAVPLSKGGTNQLSNLRGSCSNCARARPFLRKRPKVRKVAPPKPPKNPRTVCQRGHAFDEANTYVRPNGRRMCRSCRRLKVVSQIQPCKCGEPKAPGRRSCQACWENATCTKGHPYDEANTYVEPSGKRCCRKCHNARQAKRRASVA